MKAILAFLFLAICLVAMPPGQSQASSIDNGITFVADVGHMAPVAMIQEIGGVAYQQLSNVIVITHSDAVLPATCLLSDEKIILKLPVVALFYVDRLCHQTYAMNKRPPNLQSTKAIHEDIRISPIHIRADSKG